MTRIPPIRPPTWPPHEMPGTTNDKPRLITINVAAVSREPPVTCHSRIIIAPRIPKIAPDAPTDGR